MNNINTSVLSKINMLLEKITNKSNYKHEQVIEKNNMKNIWIVYFFILFLTMFEILFLRDYFFGTTFLIYNIFLIVHIIFSWFDYNNLLDFIINKLNSQNIKDKINTLNIDNLFLIESFLNKYDLYLSLKEKSIFLNITKNLSKKEINNILLDEIKTNYSHLNFDLEKIKNPIDGVYNDIKKEYNILNKIFEKLEKEL